MRIEYRCDDGQVFDDLMSAKVHEIEVARAEAIVAPLAPRPDTEKFRRGECFVQQDAEIVAGVKAAILNALAKDSPWIRGAEDGRFPHPDEVEPRASVLNMILVGKTMFDRQGHYLGPAWWRLLCIDDQSREWGDPDYAEYWRIRFPEYQVEAGAD